MPIKPRNATNTIVLLGINFHCLKGFLLLLQYRILSFYEADRLGIKLLLGFHKFIGTQKINLQKGNFGKKSASITHTTILPNRKKVYGSFVELNTLENSAKCVDLHM